MLLKVINEHPSIKIKNFCFYINGKNLDFNNFPEGKDNQNQNIQFVNIKLIDKHYFKIDGHLNKLGWLCCKSII